MERIWAVSEKGKTLYCFDYHKSHEYKTRKYAVQQN
jgi:hypothetical protein